jgi:hypothetical protein
VSDAGCKTVARTRRIDVFRHRARTACLSNVVDMYNILKDTIAKEPPVEHGALCCEGSPAKLLHELSTFANTETKCPSNLGNRAWLDGLSKKEKSNLLIYEKRWQQKHNFDPATDPRAKFVISQSAVWRETMATEDGTCPCWTKSGTPRVWVSSLGRWVTAREKANSMGFPVFANTAQAARVPVLDCETMPHLHATLGNSMCVFNILMVLVAVLASVEITDGQVSGEPGPKLPDSSPDAPDTVAVASAALSPEDKDKTLPSTTRYLKGMKGYVIKLQEHGLKYEVRDRDWAGSRDKSREAAKEFEARLQSEVNALSVPTIPQLKDFAKSEDVALTQGNKACIIGQLVMRRLPQPPVLDHSAHVLSEIGLAAGATAEVPASLPVGECVTDLIVQADTIEKPSADGTESFLSKTVVGFQSEMRPARQKSSEAVDGSDPSGGEVAPNLSTLLLKKQWLDLILSGVKVWEIRSSATTKRGVIGLGHKQQVFGECKIVDCFPVGKRSTEGILVPCSKEPGDQERFIGNNETKHRILDLSEVCYDKPHAWVLTDIVVYDEPKRLDRKQGQVIWVNGPGDGTGHPEEDNPDEGVSDVSPDDMAIKSVEDYLQVNGPTNIKVVISTLDRKGFIGLTHAWVVHYFEVDKGIVEKKKTHVVEPILPDVELPEETLELQDVISLMQRMPHLRAKLNAAMCAATTVQALDMQVRQLVADSVVEDKAKLIIKSVQFRSLFVFHHGFAKKQNSIQKLFVRTKRERNTCYNKRFFSKPTIGSLQEYT